MSVKQTAPLYPPSPPNTLEKVSREREPVASLRCRECRKLDPSVSTLFFFLVCVLFLFCLREQKTKDVIQFEMTDDYKTY